MANVTYAFNSTSEFWAQFLQNISYAFGGSNYFGLFLLAFSAYIVWKAGGVRAVVPSTLGIAILLAHGGFLPSWVSVISILIASLMFGIFMYEKVIGARR